MPYQLFQLPKQTNISSNLTLLSGAKAQFYLTGTTTPTDTYQDSARTTPHANPVVADAAGVFPPVYLDPTIVYKVVLKTSGDATLYTADPANDQVLSQDPTDAENAALVTPTDYAYEPGNVKRYGAVGDGSTSDQTAFNNAALTGHDIYVPET